MRVFRVAPAAHDYVNAGRSRDVIEGTWIQADADVRAIDDGLTAFAVIPADLFRSEFLVVKDQVIESDAQWTASQEREHLHAHGGVHHAAQRRSVRSPKVARLIYQQMLVHHRHADGFGIDGAADGHHLL